jgi:hypothetical protein
VVVFQFEVELLGHLFHVKIVGVAEFFTLHFLTRKNILLICVPHDITCQADKPEFRLVCRFESSHLQDTNN